MLRLSSHKSVGGLRACLPSVQEVVVPLESPGEGCAEVGWSLHRSLSYQLLGFHSGSIRGIWKLFKRQIPNPQSPTLDLGVSNSRCIPEAVI